MDREITMFSLRTHQPTYREEHRIEADKPQSGGRAVGGQLDRSRSGSIPGPRGVVGSRTPAHISRRPRGHVVRHALSDPPPSLLADRPRGHVVGHALGDPPPAPLADRPRGHVIGHALGDPPPRPLADRPRGHVIGRARGRRIRSTR